MRSIAQPRWHVSKNDILTYNSLAKCGLNLTLIFRRTGPKIKEKRKRSGNLLIKQSIYGMDTTSYKRVGIFPLIAESIEFKVNYDD